MVSVNGRLKFNYTCKLPQPFPPPPPSQTQYYIAGGAIGSVTLERHLRLVNAETLSWRLGSLYVIEGATMHAC